MVEFKNKILFVVSELSRNARFHTGKAHQGSLSNITIMDFENQEGLLKDWIRTRRQMGERPRHA